MDWPVCKLVISKLPRQNSQKVNKHAEFDTNFHIRHQLEHFEYGYFQQNHLTLVSYETSELSRL